ncbi:hypothetical protein QAD02_012927 [Eretmocerus hayati]|uniref:Uncharacterized protein n=1 Tax=Eretmocerus hayati TaxID=131215 RepID=A0ACC2P0Q0_9HYME|nr:hypothetical protein QAD02_012927 [Eretmocerus hayati]
MILAGLRIGPTKPDLELFPSVFRKDLKELFKGIQFQTYNGADSSLVRGLIVCGICDLPAIAMLLNMKQYNSKYGCPKYEIETKKIENVQVYPFTENIELRTTAETELHAEQALEKKSRSLVSLVLRTPG